MLVIHNANLHTLDPLKPLATALAIDHGRVIGVGMDEEILSAFSTANKYDASSHAIIPGLTDAHIHLEDGRSLLGNAIYLCLCLAQPTIS